MLAPEYFVRDKHGQVSSHLHLHGGSWGRIASAISEYGSTRPHQPPSRPAGVPLNFHNRVGVHLSPGCVLRAAEKYEDGIALIVFAGNCSLLPAIADQEQTAVQSLQRLQPGKFHGGEMFKVIRTGSRGF